MAGRYLTPSTASHISAAVAVSTNAMVPTMPIPIDRRDRSGNVTLSRAYRRRCDRDVDFLTRTSGHLDSRLDHARSFALLRKLRKPITGIDGCCVTAANGQAVAGPTIPLIRSRRRIACPEAQDHANSVDW